MDILLIKISSSSVCIKVHQIPKEEALPKNACFASSMLRALEFCLHYYAECPEDKDNKRSEANPETHTACT